MTVGGAAIQGATMDIIVGVTTSRSVISRGICMGWMWGVGGRFVLLGGELDVRKQVQDTVALLFGAGGCWGWFRGHGGGA